MSYPQYEGKWILLPSLWQGLRSTIHMSPGDGWKWKWPNVVGKSEMDLFWCISLTNNVKSCKKNQWNSSNGQLHWFPIDFLWKWSIMVQNYATQMPFLCCKHFCEVSRVCHIKADVLPFPKMWCFLCYNFLNRSYCPSKSGQISGFFLQIGGVTKNNTATILSFKPS